MKIKKIIGIAAVSIIIIVVAEILGYTMAYARITEEYIAVFTENREDFEYVAKTMQQWGDLSIIYFNIQGRYMDFEDNVSSNKQEIESEILSNKKFYESLKNLYELNKIRSIAIYGDTIEFSFSKHLKGHHVGIVYEEDINKCSCRHIIDENWVLEMKPNYHSHKSDI